LEYKRIKEVVEDFRTLEIEQSKKVLRGNLTDEINGIAQKALVDIELESLSLFKLMKVFHQLLNRMEEDKDKVVHRIYEYDYTIEDQQEYILNQLTKKRKLDFIAVFSMLKNRVHAIVTFLALLEMLSQQMITILQGDGMNNFWIEMNLSKE
jgi:segregation and condensation protein A